MITLSNKDADYIANYCRKSINDRNESYNEYCKERKGLLESAYMLTNDEKDLRELREAYDKGLAEIIEMHNNHISTLTKIIELMMTGSENE